MGNSRNKKHRNSHRHIFRKRKLPHEKIRYHEQTENKQMTKNDSRTQVRLEEQDTPETVRIEGSRIINIDKLKQYTNNLTLHSAHCGGSIVLNGETRHGLASILTGQCSACQHTIVLETSPKVKGPKQYYRWECNLAAVWGQMATGGGHSHLEETMSVLGVPTMTKASFISTERSIGQWWKEKLAESMVEAGKEEKRLAQESGSYHEGVPAITVIVDGGWSKRSHKHSYNANSGVAIIVGKATGKLLHIGVRNKFCTACAQNIPQDKHVCFKNWTASSSEMETDIVVEGFIEAERVHGVRYTKFIGDGDSSVYPALVQRVPGWGHAIQKLECANHACKCYRGALERLVQDNPSYKGSGGLTEKMRKRLVGAARCAIKMRSKEPDRKVGVKKLKRDLLNGPDHCFGHHNHCSPDFCSTAKDRISKLQHVPVPAVQVADGSGTAEDDDDDDLADVIEDQERLWRETITDDSAIEKEILQGGEVATDISPKLRHDIQVILSRLVAKAEQLVDNVTTNLAESWMHVRSKFDGGKVINRSQSGSWEHRCMGAGLQQNMGKEWGPTLWKEMTSSSPSKVFSNAVKQSAKKSSSEKKRKAKDEVKQQRRMKKYSRNDKSAQARKAYSRHDGGLSPDEIDEDISLEHLEELKTGFYQTKVVITSEEAKQIELQTRDQVDNQQWMNERRKRLTASVVGAIAKMKKTTKKSKKVESLLYNKFRGNAATRYGTAMEHKTTLQYKTYQQQHGHPGLKVESCGLVISLDNPWLAATPDGLVNDPSDVNQPLGIMEMKNPYTARSQTLKEASEKSSFCLKHNKNDNSFQLKESHDYYYQVQTQLYCTGRHWCDFVLRTDNDLHIERIKKNQAWQDKNLPKLKDFYLSALLPELACPRYHKGGIREPS